MDDDIVEVELPDGETALVKAGQLDRGGQPRGGWATSTWTQAAQETGRTAGHLDAHPDAGSGGVDGVDDLLA